MQTHASLQVGLHSRCNGMGSDWITAQPGGGRNSGQAVTGKVGGCIPQVSVLQRGDTIRYFRNPAFKTFASQSASITLGSIWRNQKLTCTESMYNFRGSRKECGQEGMYSSTPRGTPSRGGRGVYKDRRIVKESRGTRRCVGPVPWQMHASGPGGLVRRSDRLRSFEIAV